MRVHNYIEDMAVSISRGPPLEEEPELGILTLSSFIRMVTSRYADRDALVHCPVDGTGERWTYHDLWARTLAVAKALTALGLGKGERVGVLMTNRPEFLSAIFGTALAGGVATPLSTFSTASELEYLLAASACSVLLFERNVLKKDFAHILRELEPAMTISSPGGLFSTRFPYLRRLAMVEGGPTTGAIESWEAFLAHAAAIPDALVDARSATVTPADPGVLFFSSGSTSRPKGILSAHRGVTIQLSRMRRMEGLYDGVRSWTANGFFWSGNFAMVLGATLAAGGLLVLQRTFDPVEALALIESEKVTFLFAWPHQWAQLEEAPTWLDTDLSSLIHMDSSSTIARHPTVKTNWIQPDHCYGNTETFTLNTGYPANTSHEVGGNSHGPPLPGNCVKIVDPLSGKVVVVGERGEIAVKGPTLMLGYLGVPPEQTFDEDGYFRTGDGGYLDTEGRLIWEGRLNDIIKTGGANVSPFEVDEIIKACPGVRVTQTVGVPDDLMGELVVTCIVLQDGATLDAEAVRAYARQKLASYKVPRRVLFFSGDDLQLTGSAKVKTADLRALVAKRLDEEQA
jgi:acyl-CoA synthetase (AMP-forming)/AMP-acid ligase II